MIILIEGMDNTGKTTLANQLSNSLGYPYIHNTRNDNPNEVYKEISRHFDPTAPIVIQDRITPFSEAIYGPIVRGKSDFHGMHLKTLYSLSKIGLALIYCNPPEDQILNFGEREQMEGVKEKSIKLIRGYKIFFSNLKIVIGEGNHVTYDYTKDDLSKVTSFCRMKVNQYNERKRLINQCEYSQQNLIQYIAGETNENH